MKKITAALLLCLALVTTNALARECEYKEVKTTNTYYVHPVYSVNVTYFFNASEENAYALANWEFDGERTRDCYQKGKDLFPMSAILIPAVSVSELKLKLIGADDFMKLDVFPMANGHWSTSSGMISVQYSKKEEITRALAKNEIVSEVIGDARMRITLQERGPIAKMRCTDKEEALGVLNLLSRMNEVKKKAESMTHRGVNPEEVLQEFLGQCVDFQPVDAKSLVEFEQEQKLNSKIIKGEFTLNGLLTREVYQRLTGSENHNISIRDI